MKFKYSSSLLFIVIAMVYFSYLLVSFFFKNIIKPDPRNEFQTPNEKISSLSSLPRPMSNSNQNNNDKFTTTDSINKKEVKSSTWRIFNVEVPHNLDPGKNSVSTHDSLISSVMDELPIKRIPFNITTEDITVVKKAFDGRWRKSGQPKWVYTVDLTIPSSLIKQKFSIKEIKGRIERITPKSIDTTSLITSASTTSPSGASPKIVVVGAGPSGLFAAIRLVEAGYKPIIIERGEPVEIRGRDIGALFNRKILNKESNLCYGEGGAGTWSDGKLTTRIGKNSDVVRYNFIYSSSIQIYVYK
jgi:hypothetical protein